MMYNALRARHPASSILPSPSPSPYPAFPHQPPPRQKMAAEDSDEEQDAGPQKGQRSGRKGKAATKKRGAKATDTQVTPASIGSKAAKSGVGMFTAGRKRAKDVAKDRVEVEREDGNKHFRQGNFAEAVKYECVVG